MSVHTVPVGVPDAGIRLDRWFRRHYPALTQGALQKMLRTGQVRVDGKRAEGSTRLEPGQEVRIPPLPDAPPPAPMAQVSPADEAMLHAMVLYRDASVIVLDKPHGLAVQGGPGIKRHLDGMLDALRFGAEDRPRLVHRLDKDTSGVMVVAKTQAAHEALSRAFAERDLDREYLALVWGLPPGASGSIEGAIGRHPTDRKRMAVVTRGGKPALTHWRLERAFGTGAALLRVKLATGRTHQIRVHLSHINHPVVGDPVYLRRIPGAASALDKPAREALLAFPRQALHAATLGFRHPDTGQQLSFAAKLPKDMAMLLEGLET